ncbi:MAG: hypothetical protein Q9191_005189 [Dirinaria sp. TL-2023a]
MSQYYYDTVTFMKASQLVPSFMKRSLYNLITKKGQALKILVSRLSEIADPNLNAWQEEEPLRSMTVLHHLLDGSTEKDFWTPFSIAQTMLGVWFAAAHQPWINLHFVLLELCSRPEYVELIREEIEQVEGPLDCKTICQLSVLDSFIKESVRVNPLDKMAIRRKATKSFSFRSTGHPIPQGQVVCAPAWELMHDESQYPQADTFDGHRFVKDSRTRSMKNPMSGTTFTDASRDFPVWGLGSKACPGRWHSSLVMKMTLVKLIQEYDFRLEDSKKPVRWHWESFQMPYESTKMLIKKRQTSHSLKP